MTEAMTEHFRLLELLYEEVDHLFMYGKPASKKYLKNYFKNNSQNTCI